MSYNTSKNYSGDVHNSSDDEEYEDYGPAGFSAQFDVLPITLGIFIIFFNSIVFFLVFKRKPLRNPANYMLCSLALSDILTGIVSIPLTLACNILQGKTVCIVSENFLRFTSISTVLHLLAITADRYLAIIHSLRYYILVTPNRCFMTMGVIWSMSTFVAFIQLAWNNPSTVTDLYEDTSPNILKIEVPYDILNIIMFFAFPLFVMIFVNSRIFYEVVRQSNIMRQNCAPGSDENRKRQRREWKAAVIFGIMFVVYCICWLPYFLMRLQHNIGNEFFELTAVGEYTFMYLRFLSSLLNPCIYILGKNDFRNALKRKKKNRANSISKASVTKYSFLKTTTI